MSLPYLHTILLKQKLIPGELFITFLCTLNLLLKKLKKLIYNILLKKQTETPFCNGGFESKQIFVQDCKVGSTANCNEFFTSLCCSCIAV